MKSAPLLSRMLALGTWGWAAASWAQTAATVAESVPPVLTNIAQVRSLGATQAPQQRLSVHVRGVVTATHSQRQHFFLQDATGGMLIRVKDPELCPAFGQDVEVRGITGAGAGQWGIMDSEITIHGPGVFPPVARVGLSEVQAVRHTSQWVEVEGVVLEAKVIPPQFVVLQLVDSSGIASVRLPEFPASLSLTNAVGARVRTQGLNVRVEHGTLLVPETRVVSVLRPGQARMLDVPSTSVATLRAREVSLDPVAIRGTVLRTITAPLSARGIYVRDETGAFRTRLLTGRATNADDEETGLHPGDLVVVAGCPTATQPEVFLQHAALQVVSTGSDPEPRQSSVGEILDGKFASDLVAVRGRLVARQEVALSGQRWRDVLRLTAEGRELSVRTDSVESGKFAALKVNDLIEARGIVIPQENAAPGSPSAEYLVHVNSLADIHSLGLAPNVARLRTLQLAGGAAVVLLLGGSWIALLRSRLARERRVAVERQRSEAVIREANASLERRVADRTAELETARAETARALEVERELNELKSRFVSIMSHEFRTPLGIIMSAVELLRNYLDRLDTAKRRELFDDIHRSTRHMAGLMEQVLVLGRVEGGNLANRPVPLDLTALCGKLTDESLSATNRRCPIAFCPKGDLGGALGDEALLRHILSNLLSNAVKYSPTGATVEFHLHRDGADAVFTVSDRGIGIPEADLPRLFEAFRRAGNVGEIPGTGLGLLIVKRCVDLQGGKIEVVSKVGEGTTVTVRVPLYRG